MNPTPCRLIPMPSHLLGAALCILALATTHPDAAALAGAASMPPMAVSPCVTARSAAWTCPR